MIYCAQCGTANREGSNFCNHCGARLQPEAGRRCPMCGSGNDEQAEVCARCGARLVPLEAPPAEEVAAAAPAPEGPISEERAETSLEAGSESIAFEPEEEAPFLEPAAEEIGPRAEDLEEAEPGSVAEPLAWPPESEGGEIRTPYEEAEPGSVAEPLAWPPESEGGEARPPDDEEEAASLEQVAAKPALEPYQRIAPLQPTPQALAGTPAGPQLLKGIGQSISPGAIFASPHTPTGLAAPSPPWGAAPAWGEEQASTFQAVVAGQALAKEELAPAAPGELATSLLRWLLYLLIAVSIGVPLWVGGRFPSQLFIASGTQDLFNAVEEIAPGQVVLVAHDYDLSTVAELSPMATATLQHLAERGARLLNVSLNPQGAAAGERVLAEAVEGYRGYRYGQDYLHLGYLAGEDAAARAVGETFLDPSRPDYREGRAIGEFAALRDVGSWEDIDLVLVLAADPAALRRWVEQVQGPYGRPLVAGVSAQVDPLARPYYRSGQLRGLLSGVVGAAEYEQLRQRPAEASTMLGPLTLAHLAVVLLVLLANLEALLARVLRRS